MTLRFLLIAMLFGAASIRVLAVQCQHCSPDGRFGLAERVTPEGRPEIVITNVAGKGERVLAIPADDPANAILRSGWRNDRIVWADAHVNPRNGIYYEWDAMDGRLLRAIPQSQVAVSPNGRHVAWVDVVAVRPAPDSDAPALVIDDAKHVVEVRGAIGALAWSPHADELAVGVEGPGGATVVIVNAESLHPMRTVRLEADAHVRELRWDENGLVAKSEHGMKAIR